MEKRLFALRASRSGTAFISMQCRRRGLFIGLCIGCRVCSAVVCIGSVIFAVIFV